MNDSQQLKGGGIRRRLGGNGLIALFCSAVMLLMVSGCASTPHGWQPGNRKMAGASAKSPNNAPLWERPDGTLIHEKDVQPEKPAAGKALDAKQALALASSVKKPVGAYHLGAGDKVTVTIWGYAKLSRTTVIKENGTIFAPYVGNVKLAGLTLIQAQQLLTRKYNSYIRNPQLDLNIADYASKKLFLIGDLDIFKRAQMVSSGQSGGQGQAQSYSFNSQDRSQLSATLGGLASALGGFGVQGTSLPQSHGNQVNNIAAKARHDVGQPISRVVPIMGRVTLFEAMLQLNILSADVNWSGAYMIRDGHFMDVDFHRLMDLGDRSTDVMLRDGDILYLPSTRDQKVYVLGEVGAPTIVPLYKGRLRLVDALTQAGYVTTTALKDQVKVIRGGLENPMMRTINLDALEHGDSSQNIMLKAGDIVYVPNSFIGKLNDVLAQVTPSLNTLMQTLAIYSISKTLSKL